MYTKSSDIHSIEKKCNCIFMIQRDPPINLSQILILRYHNPLHLSTTLQDHLNQHHPKQKYLKISMDPISYYHKTGSIQIQT